MQTLLRKVPSQVPPYAGVGEWGGGGGRDTSHVAGIWGAELDKGGVSTFNADHLKRQVP